MSDGAAWLPAAEKCAASEGIGSVTNGMKNSDSELIVGLITEYQQQ
jgi:hypothetical protein